MLFTILWILDRNYVYVYENAGYRASEGSDLFDVRVGGDGIDPQIGL
jgi:hypothetical protein